MFVPAATPGPHRFSRTVPARVVGGGVQRVTSAAAYSTSTFAASMHGHLDAGAIMSYGRCLTV